MTPQAQNAILKTLEEPPEYAVIMLLTSNVNGLLPVSYTHLLLDRQNEFLWIEMLWSTQNHDVVQGVSYDADKLQEQLAQMPAPVSYTHLITNQLL